MPDPPAGGDDTPSGRVKGLTSHEQAGWKRSPLSRLPREEDWPVIAGYGDHSAESVLLAAVLPGLDSVRVSSAESTRQGRETAAGVAAFEIDS